MEELSYGQSLARALLGAGTLARGDREAGRPPSLDGRLLGQEAWPGTGPPDQARVPGRHSTRAPGAARVGWALVRPNRSAAWPQPNDRASLGEEVRAGDAQGGARPHWKAGPCRRARNRPDALRAARRYGFLARGARCVSMHALSGGVRGTSPPEGA